MAVGSILEAAHSVGIGRSDNSDTVMNKALSTYLISRLAQSRSLGDRRNVSFADGHLRYVGFLTANVSVRMHATGQLVTM